MGGGPPEYPVMIKSIQVVKESIPVTGGKIFTISEVDPAKCVVMLQGASQKWLKIQRFTGEAPDGTEVTKNLSPNVDPAVCEVKVFGSAGVMEISEGSGYGRWGDWVCSYLSASQVKIKMHDIYGPDSYPYYIEVIEHKEQTIFPVLVSIAAEAVTIDWAIVPDIAAEVTITVVEYL